MLAALRRPVLAIVCGPLPHPLPLQALAQRSVSDGTPSSLAYNDLASSPMLRDALRPASELSTVALDYDLHEAASARSALPPLVILHGLLGSRSNNRSVARQLAKKLSTPVYCLDLRNHGSSPHSAPHDYQHLAADVERFIKTHLSSDKPPILVGHSMGAKTAMAVALRNPKIISGLVPVDNAPVAFPPKTGFSSFARYFTALKRIESMGPQCTSLKEADAVLKEVEPSLPIRQFLLTNMRPAANGNGGYTCRVALDIVEQGLANVAGWPYVAPPCMYGGHTLLVRGTKSSYVPDESLPDVARFFPRFERLDIAAGHWVVAEQPAAFMAGLTRWLETYYL